jgi:hypothetical protein
MQVRPVVWDLIKEAVSSLADMVYNIASTKFTIRFVNNQQVLNNLRVSILRQMFTIFADAPSRTRKMFSVIWEP